jgi:squalene-hopene/tetraprenyl-beta-curcumene cyclase
MKQGQHIRLIAIVVLLWVWGLGARTHVGADTDNLLPDALRQVFQQSLDRGLTYLRQTQQADGSWQHHPGLTAVVATGFLLYPGGMPATHRAAIDKALDFVVSFAKADGGIYQRDTPNYNTAVAIMALVASGKPGYRPLIDRAQAFLTKFQVDEEEGYSKADKFYGGVGYGADLRPDLANLQFALQALKASGLAADHAAWGKAITFLERTQNRSESNDQAWAGNDGGFVYYPGFSYAGETHSYGSMTLAGVLSFSYANVDKQDPRVQDALRWIRRHYSVDENPGLHNKMLYYYYMVFAKALYIYNEPMIVDADGVTHNWRRDLGLKLVDLQYPEGYWVNDDPSWWMDNKDLVTAFTAIALDYLLSKPGAIAW